MSKLAQDVEELKTSWLNGNRKDVVDKVLAMPKVQAIVASLALYEFFASGEDVQTYLTLLDLRGASKL